MGSRTDNVDILFFTVVDLSNAFVNQGCLFFTRKCEVDICEDHNMVIENIIHSRRKSVYESFIPFNEYT